MGKMMGTAMAATAMAPCTCKTTTTRSSSFSCACSCAFVLPFTLEHDVYCRRSGWVRGVFTPSLHSSFFRSSSRRGGLVWFGGGGFLSYCCLVLSALITCLAPCTLANALASSREGSGREDHDATSNMESWVRRQRHRRPHAHGKINGQHVYSHGGRATHRRCNARTDEILRTAKWRDVDLTEIIRLSEGLDDAIYANEDKHMESHSGHMTIEPKVYTAFANLGNECVTTICEIGFNAGHSALRWLWAAPQANVILFDLWEKEYNEKAEEYIRSPRNDHLKPNRLKIIKGDSLLTVRQFHADHPLTKCNIISVDGGHSYEVALKDILNMQFLADKNFHILFVDDTNCDAYWCVDKSTQEAMRMGVIRRLDGWSEANNTRGLTVMQYL